jgi:hypothetical protein
MKPTRPLPMFAALFLAAACILHPAAVPSPEPGRTDTPPIPQNTPAASREPATSTPTPTLPSTPTSLPTPAVPAGFFPIVAGNAYNLRTATLLGGTENGNWIDASAAAARMSGGEVYSLYSPEGLIGAASGTKPERDEICRTYILQWEPAPANAPVIGTGGDWNALPRAAEDLGTGGETHRSVVRDWWAAQGHPDAEIFLTRVLRADLDGDGTSEELIGATRMSEPTGHNVEAGDYSVVLLYRAAGPLILRLAGEYYPAAKEFAFPETFSPSAVMDLNGDGRMEVIVDASRWEGGGTLVFAFDGSGASKIFDGVCSR